MKVSEQLVYSSSWWRNIPREPAGTELADIADALEGAYSAATEDLSPNGASLSFEYLTGRLFNADYATTAGLQATVESWLSRTEGWTCHALAYTPQNIPVEGTFPLHPAGGGMGMRTYLEGGYLTEDGRLTVSIDSWDIEQKHYDGVTITCGTLWNAARYYPENGPFPFGEQITTAPSYYHSYLPDGTFMADFVAEQWHFTDVFRDALTEYVSAELDRPDRQHYPTPPQTTDGLNPFVFPLWAEGAYGSPQAQTVGE